MQQVGWEFELGERRKIRNIKKKLCRPRVVVMYEYGGERERVERVEKKDSSKVVGDGVVAAVCNRVGE